MKIRRQVKRPSDIWNYFQDHNDGTGTCCICQRRFSHKTSVTNLRRHMLRIHPHIKVKTFVLRDPVELVNIENFDVNNEPAINIEEKRNGKLNKLIVKTSDSSCENDNQNLLNSKNSRKDDDHSYKDYNSQSDCSDSSSVLVNRRKRQKDRKRNELPDETKHDKVFKLSPTNNCNVNLNNNKRKFIKKEMATQPRKRKSRRHSRSYSTDSDKIGKKVTMTKPLNACDAYAINLSHQLHEMTDTQRFIAEKLISDIVFFGRFNKLSEEARFMLPQKTAASVIIFPEQTVQSTNDTDRLSIPTDNPFVVSEHSGEMSECN